MDETELLRERLQAITKKRKIQEEIALKRLEIDKENLKLQQLKKKIARDQWLMRGVSVNAAQKEQKGLDVTLQTNELQSNIHQLQIEIETLEIEELNISLNEGLILNRLKAIEKSTQDIIQAANENFKSEPLKMCSEIPEIQKACTPLNMRKQLSVDPGDKKEKQKPAVFAMEINVQKDLRTGESRVLSTCTVPAQELQQRGIKVYDDGRKSVYALHSTLDQPGANEADDLTPNEVEKLLKQATAKRKTEPMCHKNYQNSHCSEHYYMALSDYPELEYSQNSHYPYQEIHKPAQMFHSYFNQHEDYHNSNSNSYNMHRGVRKSDKYQFYDTQERHNPQVNSDVNYTPPLSYSAEPKLGILNTLPLDEPVTMIFMGYQKAEEDADSYEGSVQAELIIIEDDEEEALTSITEFPKAPDPLVSQELQLLRHTPDL